VLLPPPGLQAAIELDAQAAWDHIQASIEGGLESCTRPLGYALPECTPEELRQELLSLIQGWPATVGKQAPAEHLKLIALTESRRSAGSRGR